MKRTTTRSRLHVELRLEIVSKDLKCFPILYFWARIAEMDSNKPILAGPKNEETMSEQVQEPYAFSNEAVVYPPRKATPESQSRWWQFSLKGILLAVTSICVLLSCIVVPPIPAIGFSIVGVCYLVGLFIAMFYGRGWIRPYAICGFSIVVFSLFSFGRELPFSGPEELLCFLGLTFLAANFIGFSGAISHGFLSRRSGKVPVPNIWLLRNWLTND